LTGTIIIRLASSFIRLDDCNTFLGSPCSRQQASLNEECGKPHTALPGFYLAYTGFLNRLTG
jgi:hypothetical protein